MKLLRLFLTTALYGVLVAPMHGATIIESSNKDESLRAFNKQLWQRDFSSLWTVKQLPAFDESMNNVRPEPIGGALFPTVLYPFLRSP